MDEKFVQLVCTILKEMDRLLYGKGSMAEENQLHVYRKMLEGVGTVEAVGRWVGDDECKYSYRFKIVTDKYQAVLTAATADIVK